MKTLKHNSHRWIAISTLGAMTVGSLTMMTAPAQAVNSKTWKRIAIASAVVTGYGLIKKKRKITIAGAAATAGSYYMYRRAKKQGK